MRNRICNSGLFNYEKRYRKNEILRLKGDGGGKSIGEVTPMEATLKFDVVV